MVETGREYILQWPGHAASITERFSGLLARQALVDVTLLCQNQELRVHKLVLASCSLYFEEMLEQDLGQEPTIILNDLHFNILKAMIEFMYCGETTIAHCHLQSLLNAARVFKVKHLESLVTSMIDANVPLDGDPHDSQESDIEEEASIPHLNNCAQAQSPENDGESSSSTYIFEDSTSSCDSPPELENVLELEEELGMCDSPSQLPQLLQELDENHQHHVREKVHEDQLDSPGGIGECSRVYTHKKRTSLDDRRSQFIPLNLSQLHDSLTTDCIDLSYDKNCDISPVTFSPVDLESEYIFNMNSESIQPMSHPPNCSITDKHRSIYDDLDVQRLAAPSYNNIRKIKELFSDQNQCNNIGTTPVLRRSVRLNQLENDDTVNNNSESINCQKTKDCKKQPLKKLKKFSKIKSIKLNGKNKDSESRISDENRKHVINSRSLRSSRKIVTKNPSKFSLSREEQKSKNTKLKSGKIDKMESLDNDDYVPVKLNTIASVDRSLWGDMSDLLENCQNHAVLPDYSKSKEIPFAVGLLPLRAALERMQAIPDYQPRKTRSSVAPYKLDSCGLKRKANGDIESIVISKKQYSPERSINESDTVCHIQIHTSSQCSQSDKIVEAKRFIPVEPTSDKR
ncbi:zinc finger and BTB domain-containing protein 18.3 [Diachasma alloeum]|uniref:zinc finger and BTB domain-containing protein 18.3 n=1 Tax=Diachasma alloeum TaxID=454923 RepID=UPI0007383BD5|nr:zinc finger and BTB domain-containing protein 18.3 [Diachasma alloeum]XP_028981739.1 zinc finger and BTB domain-containing protein 18.3 [Diachasma alloeum]